jgi:heat-inducible transcriptional repressor
VTQLTVAELNARAREVFRLIVDGYLATGQPVGSRTVSRIGALGLSPASIRNVMQDLEELGLLAAPHTSAGRVPTDVGLRLFVDGMMQAQDLTPEEQAALSAPARGEGSIEAVLDRASAALAGLSHCAGVVLVPRAELVVRSFSFVPLAPERALVVLVGEDGSVENRVVALPPGVPPVAFIEAANYATARAAGRTLTQALNELRAEIAAERAELDGLARDVVARGLAVWSADAAQRPVMIVRGQAHLVGAAAADIERVRQLLDELEDKEALARLFDLAREADAMKLFIGAETNLFSLSGSAVIAAPWRAGGRVMGVVGVIGPTRLNYARIVPMVEFTAHALSQRTP